ncbi:hypothetical protein LY625_05930 [Lysobacter sp. GX 14042]|uniref:hypothetical protein n=1 Tax=Lysobacter sp. GX 14042 TaxID=2907155 RepID=UPI001F28F566|nr:hypothetical protein [Lysobacter sp. GX 14042]MCE7032160.1 hypothetical protein [Lysobacter sp. GX 14042]
MERHDAMTRRPSLLAGGPEPANHAVACERILPSIDAAPAGAPARPPARARTWLLALAALALVAAAMAWLQRPAPEPAVMAPTAATPPGDGHARASGAATIIEDMALPTEVALGPSAIPRAAPSPAPGGTAAATEVEAAGSAPDSPFASLANAGNTAGARNPFAESRAPADRHATPRPRAATPATSGDSPALLATLLGHINTRPEAGPHPQSGMDRMVGQLAREGAIAAPQAQAPGAEFRSWQIQLNLRECPPANTARGVACRKAICEVYAGRDPACPAG